MPYGLELASGVGMPGRKSVKIYSLIRGLYAAACAAVAVLAVEKFNQEYSAAILTHDTDEQIVLQMRKFDARWLASSVRGTNDLMKNCADLLLSNEMVRISPQLQAEIGDSCGAAAKAVLARSPSFARAHAAGLVAARAAVTPAAYALAEEAAPFEPWPLGIRILAAERNVSKDTGALPEALAPLVASDVDRALQSNWGRRFIASLYLRQTGLRTWIQTIAQKRPPEEQRDFLQAVKSLAARNG